MLTWMVIRRFVLTKWLGNITSYCNYDRFCSLSSSVAASIQLKSAWKGSSRYDFRQIIEILKMLIIRLWLSTVLPKWRTELETITRTVRCWYWLQRPRTETLSEFFACFMTSAWPTMRFSTHSVCSMRRQRNDLN